MKKVSVIFSLSLLIFATSCKVTFTSDLRSKIEAQGLDMKKIQYYNSQKIVMRRVLTTSDTRVLAGEVRLMNGQRVEEIVIKKNTPGVCDSLWAEGLTVRFENEKGRFLVFHPAAYGEYNLKIDRFDPRSIGTNTSEGYVQFFELNKGEVMYDGNKYYVNTNIIHPKLKIKKTESSKFDKSSRKASGVRVH